MFEWVIFAWGFFREKAKAARWNDSASSDPTNAEEVNPLGLCTSQVLHINSLLTSHVQALHGLQLCPAVCFSQSRFIYSWPLHGGG